MSNFHTRRQKERNSIILSLLFSLFIHGVIALTLSRYEAKVVVQKEQSMTPIDIVELDEQPNLKIPSSKSLSHLPSKSDRASTIAPQASPKTPISPTTATNPPPIEPTPTPSVSPAKPPTPPESATETPQTKPDPPLLTETTPVTPTPGKPDPPTSKPKTEPAETIKPVNKPPENNNLVEEQPISNLDQPAKPPKPLPKERSPDNSDRDRLDEESTVANNPDSSSDADRTAEDTDPKDDAENSDQTAANSTANEPSAPLSIACEENCLPEYPDVLDGVEGTAGIQLTVDRDGKVIDAAIAVSSGNSLLDDEALEAARKMEFNQIDRDRVTIQINLSFAVADSDEW